MIVPNVFILAVPINVDKAEFSTLFKLKSLKEGWEHVLPYNKKSSWALRDSRAVTIDALGRLWFATPQGVGYFDDSWHLLTGDDGLPFNDFTTMAAGISGDIWFGTSKGAIHYDGEVWEYRQGKRWLPDDYIRSITVTPNGDAWFATPNGISVIQHKPFTLAEKAKWYEDEECDTRKNIRYLKNEVKILIAADIDNGVLENRASHDQVLIEDSVLFQTLIYLKIYLFLRISLSHKFHIRLHIDQF